MLTIGINNFALANIGFVSPQLFRIYCRLLCYLFLSLLIYLFWVVLKWKLSPRCLSSHILHVNQQLKRCNKFLALIFHLHCFIFMKMVSYVKLTCIDLSNFANDWPRTLFSPSLANFILAWVKFQIVNNKKIVSQDDLEVISVSYQGLLLRLDWCGSGKWWLWRPWWPWWLWVKMLFIFFVQRSSEGGYPPNLLGFFS